MKVTDYGRMVLIDDSYNASPESMVAAFSALHAIASGRRMLVALGGMNELGTLSESAHRSVGTAAAKSGVSLAVTTGPYAEALAEGFRMAASSGAEVLCVPDVEILTERILERLREDDVLLVKGSRSFGMERVANAIAARYETTKEEPR